LVDKDSVSYVVGELIVPVKIFFVDSIGSRFEISEAKESSQKNH